MNCFNKVLQDLQVTGDAHGEWALIYAILKLGSYDVEGAEVETNKVRECIRRLELAGIGSIASAMIRSKLNSLEVAYDAGTVR